ARRRLGGGQRITAVGERGRRRKGPVSVASHDDRGAKDGRADAERDNVAGDAGSRYDRLRRGRVGAAAHRAGDRRRRRGGLHIDGERVGGGGGRRGAARRRLGGGQRITAVGERGRRRKGPVSVASHDDRGAKDGRADAERDNVAGDAGSRYDRLRRGRVGAAAHRAGDRR